MRLYDLTLPGADRFSDFTLFLLRLVTGAFLLYQSHDNVLSSERMAEFAGFLRQFGFPYPGLLAPFAIFWQVAAGVGFIFGFLVRPLGLITAIQFAVAVYMVHWNDPVPGIWPAAILIFLGLYCGTRGGGAIALDAMLRPARSGRRGRR